MRSWAVDSLLDSLVAPTLPADEKADRATRKAAWEKESAATTKVGFWNRRPPPLAECTLRSARWWRASNALGLLAVSALRTAAGALCRCCFIHTDLLPASAVDLCFCSC